MSYSKGLGASLGEGLTAFTQQFMGRQDQLKAQQEAAAQKLLDEQRAAQEAALKQSQLDLQTRQTDLQAGRDAFAQQQWADQKAAAEKTNAANANKDAITGRETLYRNILAPQMTMHMSGLDADLARYAPTTKDGKPNPTYDPAMFAASEARKKEALKMWTQLGSKVGTGQDWEQGVQGFVNYIGGELPAPTPIAAPVAPAPVSVPTPGTQNMERGNAAMEGVPVPVTAPPVSQSDSAPLPARVQDIAPSQLMGMDDAALVRQYGAGAADYARAARTEYTAQQKAKDAAEKQQRQDAWAVQYKELAKDPNLTPTQRVAIFTIDSLMGKDGLTPEEVTKLQDSFTALMPAIYTPAAWQKVLDTKDPATILAQLPVYQQHAPDVVKDFNPEPFITQQQAQLDKITADAAQSMAAAGASNSAAGASDASAARTTALLPGELIQQGADLKKTDAGTALTVAQTKGAEASANKTNAEIPGVRAETTQTQTQTRQAKFDLGVKQLAQMGGTGATAYQLQTATPQVWAQLKSDLGLNDAGLTAALQLARYEYNKDDNKDNLANRLAASQILTEGARRAGLIATTAGTQADTATENASRAGRVKEIDSRVKLLNQQIIESQKRGQNIDSQIKERDGLLSERKGLLTAQAAAAKGSALNSTANAIAVPLRLNIERDRVKVAQEALKIDRDRAAAYVSSVKGGYAVDMARVKQITAATALTRSQDPNDELYNERVANAKPGDPIDALKKKASVFYTQADQALKQAGTLNTQINGITSKAKNFSGNFDPTKLTPEDKAKLEKLTAQRDHLMAVAMNRRASGDQVMTDGMDNLSAPPKPETPGGGLPMKPGKAASGIQIDFAQPLQTMTQSYLKKYPGGLIPIIQEGFRTPERQTQLYNQGRNGNPGKVATNATAGQSLHNYGYATDIYWKDPKTGKTVASTDPRALAAWKQLGAMAPQFGLRWGGTFPGLVDMPHFEPAGYSWEQAQKGTAPTWGGQTATATPPKPVPAPTPAAGILPRPDTRIAGVGPPPEVKPVGLVQGLAKRITRASWVQAQGIESPQLAALWLTRTVNGLMPKGTPEQKATLRADLARTLDWAN